MSGPDKLKILHVVLSLEPGGMENGVINVAKIIQNNEFLVYVCCLEKEGDFANRFPDRKRIFVLNKKPGVSIKTVLKLTNVFRIVKPDVVHTHNFGPLIYTCAAKLLSPDFAWLHGEHGMIKNEDNTRRKIALRKFCYKFCDKVHTVSDGLKNYYVSLGFPKEKIISIINGVDLNVFKPGDKTFVRKKLGLPESAVILGVVGRFDRGKRHRELIEAFNKIAVDYPSVYLFFVGDGGTDYENVKELADNSPHRNRIIFAGYQRNMPPFYQAMDLLVIPSLKEGFPNVLLEAMACGVPALAHPTPGTKETIADGEDGILRNLEKIETIANSLKDAIADMAKIKQMGENARKKVENQFSIEKMADSYAEVYRNLCCSKPSSTLQYI